MAMIDVATKVKEIIGNGLTRFATQNGIPRINNQFVIHTKDDVDALPLYQYLINYEFSKDLKFNDILGVKIDMLGYGGYAKKYLAAKLKSFAAEYNCIPSAVKAVLTFDKTDGETLKLYVYINGEYVKELNAEELAATAVSV